MATSPIVVQDARSLLLDATAPEAARARDVLARCAEIVSTPGLLHSYRLTPLSLWNAAAVDDSADGVIAALDPLIRGGLPHEVATFVREHMGRYGRLRLRARSEVLLLEADDPALLDWVQQQERCRPWVLREVRSQKSGFRRKSVEQRNNETTVQTNKSAERRALVASHKKPLRPLRFIRPPFALRIDPAGRGALKAALAHLGFPLLDEAGYVAGARLDLALREDGARPFSLRPYQQEAVARFYAEGSARGGSGVVVLPCGAGKTLVGVAAITAVGAHTLILCPGTSAARQWLAEIQSRTTLDPALAALYDGDARSMRPVTIATYQMLGYRGTDGTQPHLRIFHERNWGLIIYDEVHMLPAPVFRLTASIQSRRRLGLTATLVREDGREHEVFALVGPRCYEAPWRALEAQGWIAPARCVEIRVDLPPEQAAQHAYADDSRRQYRIAATNPAKIDLVARLLTQHPGEPLLVIGQYLDQLQAIAQHIGAPLVNGATPQRERERIYHEYRRGAISALVLSKVANQAIDLPAARVAIQVSGSFGSRQEEAQRLGRVLRPKPDGRGATFYTLVTRDSREEAYAAHRQIFLAEQGYRYEIRDAEGVLY
jgi:DNA excision repair protein ERCC-3